MYCNKLPHSVSHCVTHSNELQRVVILCNALQRIVTLCNALQHTATCAVFNPLQRQLLHSHNTLFEPLVSTPILYYCIILHHTESRCNTLLASHIRRPIYPTATPCDSLQYTCTHCNTLATHINSLPHTVGVSEQTPDLPDCNTLQLIAIHLNTLQHTCNTHEHTATHCWCL